MKAKKNAAAEITHTAAESGAELLADAKSRVAPLYEQGKDRLAPLYEQGRDRLTPLLEQGKDRFGPIAEQATQRGAGAANQALEALQPKVNDALDKVGPAVDVAKDRLDEWLPKISSALEDAAGHPAAVQAQERGKAAVAALKGEVAVPEKKKRKVLLPLLIVAGLAAGAAVAWKKFMGPGASEWEAYDATAYKAKSGSGAGNQGTGVPSTTGTDKGATDKSASFGESVQAPSSEAGIKSETSADPVKVKAENDDKGAGKAAGAAGVAGVAGAAASSKYGKDAYEGSEPPAGFDIKGNERSMKFHTPDSGGYERTIADVWFTNAAAAEAAGFTKAQR